MSEYQWFVILSGKKEGPFTVPMLLRMEGITPDTLAWREGMDRWLPIREIKELELLFIENENAHSEESNLSLKGSSNEDLVISLPNQEPPLIFWLFFILILFIYVLYQIQ